MTLLMDYLLGYKFLCKLFRRPVAFFPPRLTWLIDIIGTEKFDQYLASLGYETIDEDEGAPLMPKKFGSRAPFDRSMAELNLPLPRVRKIARRDFPT
jgi:hypothetical protein